MIRKTFMDPDHPFLYNLLIFCVVTQLDRVLISITRYTRCLALMQHVLLGQKYKEKRTRKLRYQPH